MLRVLLLRGLVLVVGHPVLAVEFLHQMNVDKDQGNKDIDGALLRPPETQFEAEKWNLIEFLDKQNAKTK